MRLFLASSFGAHLDKLRAAAGGDNPAVLFIMNAADKKSPFSRFLKKRRHIRRWKRAGFRPVELDLRKFFDQRAKLRRFIKKQNPAVIFASGGNTFILRRAFKQSGFDDILRADLKENKYIYGGSSAGAVILCRDLRYYIGPDDEPTESPAGYETWPILEGLGLVKEYIVPHYDAEWFEQYAKQAVREITRAGKPVIKLREESVLMVNGRRTELYR
jgi:dipeptidase E